MIVTEIRSKNKNKSIVCLDGEIAFVLYKGDFNRYGIVLGEELSDSSYKEITEEILPKRAYERACKLLMSRDYTVKQLQQKLYADGYPEETVQKTIEKLEGLNYLDDQRYTQNFIFWKSEKKSRSRMISDLRQRGIDSDVAVAVYAKLLEADDIDNEEIVIKRFLDKKGFVAKEADYDRLHKMIQTLLRKGFSYESIRHVLGKEPEKCFTE